MVMTNSVFLVCSESGKSKRQANTIDHLMLTLRRESAEWNVDEGRDAHD